MASNPEMDYDGCNGAGRVCLKLLRVSDFVREAAEKGELSDPAAVSSFHLRHLDWRLLATFSQVEDKTFLQIVFACLGPSFTAGEKRKSWWDVRANVQFSFLRTNGSKLFTRVVPYHFTECSDAFSFEYITYQEMQDPAHEGLLHPDGSIVLEACIAVGLPGGANCGLTSKKLKLEVAVKKQHVNDLGDLLKSGDGADCSIAAEDGHEIKAHSLILKARCPEFFRQVFSDGNVKHVKIEGLSAAALSNILMFIYTGELAEPISANEMLDIAQSAEDFGLRILKELVVVKILENLSSDNALYVLSSPKVAGIPELGQAVRVFIKNNLDACLDAAQGYTVPSKMTSGSNDEAADGNGRGDGQQNGSE